MQLPKSWEQTREEIRGPEGLIRLGGIKNLHYDSMKKVMIVDYFTCRTEPPNYKPVCDQNPTPLQVSFSQVCKGGPAGLQETSAGD
jgi:hypothetical protein